MSTKSEHAFARAHPEPLRVLFVIGSVGPGGAEELLINLLVQCRPAIEPLLVTLSTAGEPHDRLERLEAAGISRIVLSPGRGPKPLRLPGAVTRLERVVRRFGPHVVSAWLEEPSLLLTPLARMHRLPVVTVRHNVGGSPTERSALMRQAVKACERRATLVAGVSEAVLSHARGRGIQADRLRLVQNGCEVTAALPMPDGPEVALGYVAGFRSEKGHLRLLAALRRLETTVPWRVDLAGDGPLRSVVEAEISRLGLDEHVRILGHIDNVREFWKERSVGVLLSDYEGGGQALIEAAMAGRPTVGTDSGATREVVAPGTGFLVPVDDPARTAAALKKLIDDPELRSRAGEAAHRHVAERYSMERFVSGQVDVLREAYALSPSRNNGF